MQLVLLTAVLMALAAAEAPGGPVAGVPWRLALVTLATLASPLAALVGTLRLAPALTIGRASGLAIQRLQGLVAALWLGGVAVVLFVARWPQIVQANWGCGQWPLVDELAVLLPVIVPLVLVWAVWHRLESEAHRAATAAGLVLPAPPALRVFLGRQLRQQLGLVLLPPLAIVGVVEALGWRDAAADWRSAWWLVGPLVGLTLLLLPVGVRYLWVTEPLPAGALRDLLTATCRERSCAVSEILLWNTGGAMANAAVVGMVRRLRYLLLTDALVARLSAAEIAAVTRHELAHLRRWHLPLRLALLLLPLAGWLALGERWPAGIAALQEWAESLGALPALALPLGLLVYAVLVVGWYSRLLEHDADLDACQTTSGRWDADLAEPFCRALVTLCGRSRESRLTRWLHPSLGQRLRFLRSVEDEEQRGLAFRRRLRAIALAMALLYVAAGLLAAV